MMNHTSIYHVFLQVYRVGGWIVRDIYLHASPEFASLSVLHFGRTIHKLT